MFLCSRKSSCWCDQIPSWTGEACNSMKVHSICHYLGSFAFWWENSLSNYPQKIREYMSSLLWIKQRSYCFRLGHIYPFTQSASPGSSISFLISLNFASFGLTPFGSRIPLSGHQRADLAPNFIFPQMNVQQEIAAVSFLVIIAKASLTLLGFYFVLYPHIDLRG